MQARALSLRPDRDRRVRKMEARLERSRTKTLRLHTRLAQHNFEKALDVVGAFVTFQHQPGRRAMLELCRGGLPWLLQPAYVRYPARGPPAAAVAAARAVLTPEEEDDDAAIAGATEVCSRLGRLRVSRISAMNQPLLGDESATARR